MTMATLTADWAQPDLIPLNHAQRALERIGVQVKGTSDFTDDEGTHASVHVVLRPHDDPDEIAAVLTKATGQTWSPA